MINLFKTISEFRYKRRILKINSKIKNGKKIDLQLENKEIIKQRKFLFKIPKTCNECNSKRIIYWDETEEEIIFKCLDCKSFCPISLNSEKLLIFFKF